MSDIPWWVWLIVVAVVLVIIIALVVRRKPTAADNIHDPGTSPHVPAGTAEDVSTSQAATTNSAGQAMTSGSTAATAGGGTGATSGARRMARDDDASDAAASEAGSRRASQDRPTGDDDAFGEDPNDDVLVEDTVAADDSDEVARAEEARDADQPRREATDPHRVAEEQRGHASDEEAPPHSHDDRTLGVAEGDESSRQASAQDDDAQAAAAHGARGFEAEDPEAGEAPPAARGSDNVDATIGAEAPGHYQPSTHGHEAVESQRRLTEDLGLNPEDDPHGGHSHGGQAQGYRDASTGPGPDHKPYDFPQDTEADTGVPLADADQQLHRAEMREQSRGSGYGDLVDSGEERPDLTVDPGSTPPIEDAGPDTQDPPVTETESSAAPSTAAPADEAPKDASGADAPTGSDAGEDFDVPRDEYGRRLDPYGNPVED